MEGCGEPGSSKDRQPWTLEMMLENREKWNLAADIGVLEYMKKFGNDLLNETENTLKALDSFESELNNTCVQVSNITNEFLSLADTQFVENRVCDEDEQKPSSTVVESTAVSNANKTKLDDKEVSERLKEAINNGLDVLKTKFEVLEVVNSDSEDDDNSPTGLVYKPINPFDYRPLPHLIGSVEFMKDPTVGLEDPQSDDDDYEESLGGTTTSESKAVSEENEDSEPESDRPNLLPESSNYRHEELADILYKQPISSSFADHLTKRLEDMDNERKVVHQPEKPTRNLFSSTPPPLDDSCDDEFGSSEDLIFGNRNNRKAFDDDLFVPKSKSSLWNDDDDNGDNKNIPHVSGENDNLNDRRKGALSDFEKELSRNLQKRRYGDDTYGNILSPSPPPLDDEADKSNNDASYSDRTEKISNKNDLFNDDYSKDSLFSKNPLTTDNDFIGSDKSTTASSSQITKTGSTKKKLPGAVNIFGANIVKDRKDLIANTTSKLLHDRLTSQNDVDTNKDVSENDNQVISRSISNLRKRNYSNDEDSNTAENVDSIDNISTEDVNNSIFKSISQQQDKSKSSSRSSSVKMSESFQDDNMSIKSNRSGGLFDDVVTNTTKKSAIKKNMDDLFSDLNYQNDDGSDDDLFSSYAKSDATNKTKTVSSTVTGKPNTKSDTIIDDLFGEIDNTDLFSSLNVSKRPQTESRTSKSGRSDLISNKGKEETISTNKPSGTSFFDEDDELMPNDIVKNPVIQSYTNKSTSSEANKSKIVDSLFDNTDDSDIFGNSSTKNDVFTSRKSTSNVSKHDELQKSTHSKPSGSSKIGTANLFNNEMNEENLFSEPLSRSVEKHKIESNVKTAPTFEKVGDKMKAHTVASENKSQTLMADSSKVGVKTAKVKHISLFSDEEDSTVDLLFTNTLKLTKNKEVKDHAVTDDMLFNDRNADNSSLFSEVNSSEKKLTGLDKIGSSLDDDDDNNKKEFKVHQIEGKSELHSNKKTFKSNNFGPVVPDDVPVPSLSNVSSDVNSSDKNKDSVNKVPIEEDHPSVFNDANKGIREDSPLFDRKLLSKDVGDLPETDKIFDEDKSLPSVPSTAVVTKKPDVPTKPKPSKPEPPKTLNLQAPILPPDPVILDSSSSKISSIKQKLDVPDGSAFSSDKSSASSGKSSTPPKVPGKLNLEKTLNIDPKALLPGARPISFKKPSSPIAKDNEPLITEKNDKRDSNVEKAQFGTNENIPSSDKSSLDSQPVLHSIAKDRVKIQVKRRPQTRKARQEAVRKSMIDVTDYDEVDSSSTTNQQVAPKSASDSLLNQQTNILSPSTDEEDLFGVPPLDISTDYVNVTTSPSDIYYPANPTIISHDLNTTNSTKSSSVSKLVTNVSSESKSTVDLFKSEHSSNDKPLKNSSPNEDSLFEDASPVSDLFVGNNTLDTSPKDLFKDLNTVGNNDLFADVKVSVKGEPTTDDLFASSKLDKEESHKVHKKTTDKIVSLFSDEEDVSTNDDLFTHLESAELSYKSSDDKSIVKEGSEDSDLFTSKGAYNNKKDVKDNVIPPNKDIDVKTVKTDRSGLFSEFEDSDLFGTKETPGISSVIKPEEKTGELVKQDSSTNIICNVFNSGIVNICHKLSVTPPNDKDLFPPTDWSVSNVGTVPKNATITSAPEKIKSATLLKGDSLDDDQLFANISEPITKKSADRQAEPSGVHVKEVNKQSVASNMLFDEEDDEVSLFGEVKAQKKHEPVVNPAKTFTSESKSNTSSARVVSLFDEDDDPGDIFATMGTSKSSSKSSSIKKSSEDVFSSSSYNTASTKKPSSGSSKKSSLHSTKVASANENKDSSKDNFIDPLSAFADKD